MGLDRIYYVYLLASRSRNLYTGVTNNLERRVIQHRLGLVSSFTQKYRIHRLVYFEAFGEVLAAIQREKQIKSWRRAKKIALIEAKNPAWDDLAATLCPPPGRYKQVPRSPSFVRQSRPQDKRRTRDDTKMKHTAK